MNSEFRPGRHSRQDYGDALQVRADVAVIGAGAGGCATAAALAERGLSVVVLEEGRHWKPADFKADTAFAFKHLYQGRGTRALRGNTVIPMPGGRGVGGSTLINSAICFRCPDSVLADWRDQHGCASLTSERFDAYFDRIWKTLGVSVNPMAVQRNNNLIFRDGAEALGLNGAFLARSAPGCVGCGICQYGCPTGGKLSADRSFLAGALATGRVGVYAGCRVSGVETQGDQVKAITGHLIDPVSQRQTGTLRVRADAFILAGGPIGSPMFLLANGLADNKHCGQHLVVHPTVGSMARFEQEIRPWTGVTQGYYVDCWERGFLLQTYTVTPDQYFLTLQTQMGEATEALMANLSHMASAGALIHDEDSSGEVRYTPAGPDLSYRLGEGDKRRLIEGLRLTAKVFFAAGALEALPGCTHAPRIQSAADIDRALPLTLSPRELLIYASHPMGTCRMGASPDTSVVDTDGRVWGWANLRVADASVFPTSLGVNPQVTTMAMGLMVGHSVAES
jgi:choline dehydrogenase-like flavoprotein